MRLSGSGGGLPQPPRAIRDVYRDLADRRLAFVPVALLALLIAVPLLLANSPEAEPPPDPPDAEIAARAALETQPVVVREAIGLRDYRKRLSGLTRSNPFDQQYRDIPELEQALETTESEGGGEVSTGTTVSPSEAVSRGGGGGGGSAPSPSGSGAGSSGTGSEPSSPPAPTKPPETRYYEFLADVSMRLNDGRVAQRRVRPMDVLPTENVPLMFYMGSTLDLKLATFTLVSGARGVLNGGECLPSPERCQVLRLRPGGAARLSIPVVNGEEIRRVTFEIHLDRLHSVEVSDPGDGDSDRRQRSSTSDSVEKQAGASALDLMWRITGKSQRPAPEEAGGTEEAEETEDSEDASP